MSVLLYFNNKMPLSIIHAGKGNEQCRKKKSAMVATFIIRMNHQKKKPFYCLKLHFYFKQLLNLSLRVSKSTPEITVCVHLQVR